MHHGKQNMEPATNFESQFSAEPDNFRTRHYGRTSLHWAASYSYYDVVRELINGGADQNKRDK